MSFSLPLEADTKAFLIRGPLRNFAPRGTRESRNSKRYTLSFQDFPVPRLLAYSLRLAGIEVGGPHEKVEWWSLFLYRDLPVSLAHEKFGLRLSVPEDLPPREAAELVAEIGKQLLAATRAVEKIFLGVAPGMMRRGDVTVVNQHYSLERAYLYFRGRALAPDLVEDEYKVLSADSSSLLVGENVMRMNAFHDMVAAITAFLSRLEHDLVLALPFANFDSKVDNLATFVGIRWGEKYDRIFRGVNLASQYRRQLTDVVERWRNPYSHGGFEKNHAATIYLHAPNVGALPVGLTKVRDSPLFSFFPATESTIEEVFRLFDDFDDWMAKELKEATRWIDSGLDVRFDSEFRGFLNDARANRNFDDLIEYFQKQRSIADNMDY